MTPILSDQETRVDLLNNAAISHTVCQLLHSLHGRPVTIGIHGDWGAGKSSVLEMIDHQLGENERTVCLKFNGWQFEGFEDAKIALIEGIITALVDARPALRKAGDTVKNLFRRIDWLKVARNAGGLLWTASTGIPSPDMIQSAVGALRSLIQDPAASVSRDQIEAVAGMFDGAFGDGVSRQVPEEVRQFRADFDQLLEAAEIDQLVVLVDDLDRCLPETAVATLEAIRLFVMTSRTAFIIAADEAMIEYSVRKHFPSLPESSGPLTYAQNYLEKLIQVPFRIPALGVVETQLYITLLLLAAEMGEDSDDFDRVLSLARERLKTPWEQVALSIDDVKGAAGDVGQGVQEALNLSTQIGPTLASGTCGNPRQIKRFLNAMSLRLRIAESRGFGKAVKRSVLAKLMLAERFYPQLFDAMVDGSASAADGACPGLDRLEADPGEKRLIQKSSRKPAQEESQVDESGKAIRAFLEDAEARRWAMLSPSLSGVDLRPYLFLAKDRRGFFGGLSSLGPLEDVANKLMGPEIVVRPLQPMLVKLTPSERARLFDVVRGRILAAEEFSTQPRGTDGLKALCEADQMLQRSLLDLLDSLPQAKLGPWVVGGWAKAISEPDQKLRYQRLIERWAAFDDNAVLCKAAQAAGQLTKDAD
ncbi:MAG: Qat anti-phage system ATPase QatA [Planctomycetota bacterium]